MNSKILKTLVLVLLLLAGDKTFSQSAVFSDGEELIYDVYYSFINIFTNLSPKESLCHQAA